VSAAKRAVSENGSHLFNEKILSCFKNLVSYQCVAVFLQILPEIRLIYSGFPEGVYCFIRNLCGGISITSSPMIISDSLRVLMIS